MRQNSILALAPAWMEEVMYTVFDLTLKVWRRNLRPPVPGTLQSLSDVQAYQSAWWGWGTWIGDDSVTWEGDRLEGDCELGRQSSDHRGHALVEISP